MSIDLWFNIAIDVRLLPPEALEAPAADTAGTAGTADCSPDPQCDAGTGPEACHLAALYFWHVEDTYFSQPWSRVVDDESRDRLREQESKRTGPSA